jgi:subtilisin family serine protease
LRFAAGILCSCALAQGAAAAILNHPHVPGELIVQFVESVSPSEQASVHAAMGAREVQDLGFARAVLVKFDSAASLEELQRRYEESPLVASADANYWGEGGFIPNDTHYSAQWHHNNTGQSGGTSGADIESEAGWDLSRGSSSVVVAVLDSGIDSDHPEFAGRIVAGYDCVNEDNDPEDDHSHGTYVSGLLAANADNAFAVVGVDHSCMIMPIKVLNQDNGGTTADLIQGLGIASKNGADVFNMSLINYPTGGALQTALRDAKEAGAILMACAGNGGIGDADVSGPGASTHTISIGATDHMDTRASYSGTGDALEFVAPGHLVRTVFYGSDADGWAGFAGCSAATPVASGIVSILRGLDPSLRTMHIRPILKNSAEDQVGPPIEDTPGWDEFFGWGRLNLKRALEYFLATTAPSISSSASGMDLSIEPNPSAEISRLSFSLARRGWVHVSILDVSGRKVRALFDGIRLEGKHAFEWDGRDDQGDAVAAGIYFARVESGGEDRVRKLARVR